MSLNRYDDTIPVRTQGEAIQLLQSDEHLPEKVDKNRKKRKINKPAKKMKGKKMKVK